MKKLSYKERSLITPNIMSKQLLTLIDLKKTNLAFSADVTQKDQLVALAEQLGPEICLLKTHIDIIIDFDKSLTQKLKSLAKQNEFLIFEDRKFADIGHTVRLQYQEGIYRIADWADIINAHSLPGPGIIEALNTSGLLLLANMSSKGCLADQKYIDQTVQMANAFPETVMGFITPYKISDQPGHIHLTPGIQFNQSDDTLGQQYVTPDFAIKERQTDVIIVGRGILQAKDPLNEAKRYRKAGWDAYLSII